MQKTVIILVAAREMHLSPGQPLVVTISDSMQDVAISIVNKTSCGDESTMRHESAPAFWTWFIENPRPQSGIQLR